MVQTREPRDGRPDPDALLALAAKDARGRLKIFLGAAPGVGKTFAMLSGARSLRETGLDIVVGLVETHERKETTALLEGLELLPRRNLDYRGQCLEEFDLDGALARHPRILIVDELAHTNAPDCRHPKRWQDVEELLGAGIDVWTALNIQHLESLADVVARITGVSVRETVPDKILQRASDVVLVDITPDELIERLNAGKIYVPETARLAIKKFFTIGNLTALRELALRRTADRVDDQMIDYLRQKSIEGPWETTERLLVCIGSDARSQSLVRKVSRLATALNATWIAAHLDQPIAQDPAKTRRASEALHLAESLGGEIRRLKSNDFTKDILRLARAENVTQIFIGRSSESWLSSLRGRSLSDQILRHATDIGVHIEACEGKAPSKFIRPISWRIKQFPAEVALAAFSVIGAIGIAEALSYFIKLPNLSMIFLAAVLLCAVKLGTRSAILAAFLSFLAYNFFFIEPIYTFSIAEPYELFALLIFLAVAMLTGSLMGRVRNEAKNAQASFKITQALIDFSNRLSGASSVDDVLWASASQAHRLLGGHAIFLVQNDDELQAIAAWPPDELLDTGEKSAARWAYEKSEAAGWRTGTLPNVRFRFEPLVTPRGAIGVFGFTPRDALEPLTPEDEGTANAIIEQTTIALERAFLVKESVVAAATIENEKTRDALLASLSHDLRTPLASITGAVTTLRELDGAIAAEDRNGLLLSIEQETARLTRFVSNLLDMSRIEAGAVKMRRDWVDVADTIRTAVDRNTRAYPDHPPRISLSPKLPFIRGDQHLLEQTIFNLLDNAQKYGGHGAISVHARPDGADVLISVTDEGPGIKPGELDRVFEKFYRAGGADGRKPGTGLGLSICKGLIEAMGGIIQAESPAARRRGVRMIVRLPAAVAEAKAPL